MEIKLNGTQIKMLEQIKNKTCCIEDLSKHFSFSYGYTIRKITQMKNKELIVEIMDNSDGRRKNLIPTKRGLLILKIIQRKKSFIAKADAWMEEQFAQLGVEFDKKCKIPIW